MLSDNAIQAAIRNLKSGSKELRDHGEHGSGRLVLQLRASEAGKLAKWYAMFYRGDKRRSKLIGSYPAMSLAEARQRFREDYAPVISEGKIPTGQPQRRAIATSKKTVVDLFEAYVAYLRQNGKRSAYSIERALLTGAYPVVSSIGRDTPACEVTPTMISDHIKPIANVDGTAGLKKARSQADAVRSHVRAAYSFALKSGHSYFSVNTAGVEWGITSNPAAAIPADPDANRVGKRYLAAREFRIFWEAMKARQDVSISATALMVAYATGQRIEEVLQICNPHHRGYDGQSGMYMRREKMLYWPDTKTHTEHAIPICPIVCKLLDGLPVGKGGHLFIGLGSRGSEPSARKVMAPGATRAEVRKFLDTHDFAHFTPRDARRTWKTLAGRAGISKDMRDKLQNHKKGGDVSAIHYDKHDYLTEKREAVAKWAAYLDQILSGALDHEDEENSVIAIHRKLAQKKRQIAERAA